MREKRSVNARLQAVFFDVDDTLFDRNRAQREILDRMVREIPDLFGGICQERILDAFMESDLVTACQYQAGMPFEGLRARRSRLFLNLLGLSLERADRLTEMYVELYPVVDAPVRDARSVVEGLAQRFKSGVISNGFPDVQYRKLTALGIRHAFDCIVLSGELGLQKPDPAIFRHAAAAVGTHPGECLHVGDSYADDVIGARRAGMQACWFNPSGLAAGEVQPDLEIRALVELLEVLDQQGPQC
jgi:putative hydrolase of the HAD superfamily